MVLLKKFVWILLLAMVVTGCGPVYRTSYSYVPPPGMNGRMCIMQCIQAKNMCDQMCEMKHENCKSRRMNEARYYYDDYKQQRLAQGKSVDRSLNSFNYSSCNQNCHCVENYNDCYSLCGGQVLVHRQCTAFCKQ